MPETPVAKPVIKVYLLPPWDEDQLQNCFHCLVEAVKSIPVLQVRSEDDVIVLMNQDRMTYGLGTEILIEVDVSKYLVTIYETEDAIAKALVDVMQALLPDAHIQCKVHPFDTSRGFWATGME